MLKHCVKHCEVQDWAVFLVLPFLAACWIPCLTAGIFQPLQANGCVVGQTMEQCLGSNNLQAPPKTNSSGFAPSLAAGHLPHAPGQRLPGGADHGAAVQRAHRQVPGRPLRHRHLPQVSKIAGMLLCRWHLAQVSEIVGTLFCQGTHVSRWQTFEALSVAPAEVGNRLIQLKCSALQAEKQEGYALLAC